MTTTLRPLIERNGMVCLCLVALSLAAFWGHWEGDFVYDDVYQIRGNGLLRTWTGTWEAMSQDVWAFKGEREEAWSNYWRPTFVAWLALNYRIFGLESPTGWHWSSLLLHCFACCLGFRFLVRARVPALAAFTAAAVFAVHPAHVESVGWISGSPDPLMTCLLLGSLLALPAEGRPRISRPWILALALYVLALLTKEVAVLAALLVFALDTRHEGTPLPLASKLRRAAPFAVIALAFVGARRWVLGAQEVELPWHLGPLEHLLTAPKLLGFYLRQTLVPTELSPIYPLRTTSLAHATSVDWLAVGALVGCLAAALYFVRKHRELLVPTCLFALPLLPALNVGAFHPEQLVHDRYLFLPLLGAWAVLAILAARALRRAPGLAIARGGTALALVVVGLLGYQTQRYLPTWQSARALWERAVEVDTESAFAWALYGEALRDGGDPGLALDAYNRSIQLFSSPLALTARAHLLTEAGQLEPARRDLEAVVAAQPDNTLAVERLAVVYQRLGALRQAEELLRSSRQRIPYYGCTLTAHLGVILYLQDRKADALAELETLVSRADETAVASCQLGLFHLGALYAERGEAGRARAAYSRFLEITRSSQAAVILDRRRQAESALEALA